MNSNLIVHSSTIHDSVRYIKNRGPRPWLRRASSSTRYGRRSVATSSDTNNLSSASPVEHSLSWSLPIRRLWARTAEAPSPAPPPAPRPPPLVVPAHPAVVAQPREGPFRYPAPWQYL